MCYLWLCLIRNSSSSSSSSCIILWTSTEWLIVFLGFTQNYQYNHCVHPILSCTLASLSSLGRITGSLPFTASALIRLHRFVCVSDSEVASLLCIYMLIKRNVIPIKSWMHGRRMEDKWSSFLKSSRFFSNSHDGKEHKVSLKCSIRNIFSTSPLKSSVNY